MLKILVSKKKKKINNFNNVSIYVHCSDEYKSDISFFVSGCTHQKFRNTAIFFSMKLFLRILV